MRFCSEQAHFDETNAMNVLLSGQEWRISIQSRKISHLAEQRFLIKLFLSKLGPLSALFSFQSVKIGKHARVKFNSTNWKPTPLSYLRQIYWNAPQIKYNRSLIKSIQSNLGVKTQKQFATFSRLVFVCYEKMVEFLERNFSHKEVVRVASGICMYDILAIEHSHK